MRRRLPPPSRAGAVALLAAASLAGCVGSGPANPALTLTKADRADLLRAIEDDAVPLVRPVVVIGGYRAPDPLVEAATGRLARLTSGDRGDFLRVTTWFDRTTEAVIERACREAAERFGTLPGGRETVEVDVIGLSMGGVIARAAAIAPAPNESTPNRPTPDEPAASAEPGPRPRLNIRRLFTVATPHRGAILAERFAFEPAARDLRAGSDFLAGLDEAWAARTYQIVPYGVLRDGIVGVENTAPPGLTPVWTRGKVWGSHITSRDNDEIVLDIARRLRGEPPVLPEGVPLPEEGANVTPPRYRSGE